MTYYSSGYSLIQSAIVIYIAVMVVLYFFWPKKHKLVIGGLNRFYEWLTPLWLTLAVITLVIPIGALFSPVVIPLLFHLYILRKPIFRDALRPFGSFFSKHWYVVLGLWILEINGLRNFNSSLYAVIGIYILHIVGVLIALNFLPLAFASNLSEKSVPKLRIIILTISAIVGTTISFGIITEPWGPAGLSLLFTYPATFGVCLFLAFYYPKAGKE